MLVEVKEKASEPVFLINKQKGNRGRVLRAAVRQYGGVDAGGDFAICQGALELKFRAMIKA